MIKSGATKPLWAELSFVFAKCGAMITLISIIVPALFSVIIGVEWFAHGNTIDADAIIRLKNGFLAVGIFALISGIGFIPYVIWAFKAQDNRTCQ